MLKSIASFYIDLIIYVLFSLITLPADTNPTTDSSLNIGNKKLSQEKSDPKAQYLQA